MEIPAELEGGDGTVARVKVGKDQYLRFRETDRPQPDFDGHHVQIYITNFSGPYRRLAERGLITREDNQYQYRFCDIVDPRDGRHLFTVEHEVRSATHPMYLRPLVNRDPAQTNRNYAHGHDQWPGRWIRTRMTDADLARPALAGMLASQRDLFDVPGDICYLNSASYSPLPIRTLEAGRAAVLRKGRPWTLDAGFASRQHERARAAAARLINAEAADIALNPLDQLRRRHRRQERDDPARHARPRAGKRSFLAGAGMADPQPGAGVHHRDGAPAG
jgi:hypothetical protein